QEIYFRICCYVCRHSYIVENKETESEFISLTEVCRNLLYDTTLLNESNVKIEEPVTAMEDNTACIQIAFLERVKGRSKDIDIRYCYVKEAIKEKQIKLYYCPSTENYADVYTKPLMFQKHKEPTEALGMKCSNNM
ncbi:hypothetical protein JRQ81_007037, partial [Phrynocephalus forsythii]